jgi:hypothetical protein
MENFIFHNKLLLLKKNYTIKIEFKLYFAVLCNTLKRNCRSGLTSPCPKLDKTFKNLRNKRMVNIREVLH